jgi:hypothetical protein
MLRSISLAVASFVLGGIAATWWTAAVTAQDRKTDSRELLRMDLGDWCPGKEVLISQLTSTVGTAARHSHPAHSFTYVIEGAQTISPDGQPSKTARAGDIQYEAPYAVSSTRTTEPTKSINIRILEKGKPVTIPAK